MQPRSLASRMALVAGLLIAAAPARAIDGAPQARGIGATFPEPAYALWAKLFAAEGGERISYQGAGSGAGVKAIEASGVTFGATDAPLAAAELRSRGLVQVPTLIGGIVPVIDVPGVGPGDLVLDGQSLADLFMGRIAFWDDPALVDRNAHLPLPHLAVVPVRRADASGTTSVFAAYLARVSNQDQAWLGQTPPALRPIGVAAEGSKGMADAVAATPGAIGYVGFDYAQANRLAYPDLVNGAGLVVQPTLNAIAAAAASADWSHGLAPSLLDAPGAASWPIVSATYVLMRRVNADATAARGALHFFAWSARAGGPAAEDLGFVPLPAAVAEQVRREWDAVSDASGQSLVTAR